MKKDLLAIIIIFICCLGTLIGLVNSFKAPEKDMIESSQEKKDTLGKFFKGSKIAIIRLNGVISDVSGDSDFFPTTSPAMKAKKYINRAAKDKSVKAVILRINSPGGTVGASQEVYHAVLRCRAKKPVVVSMGDVCASGGYYIASAADSIVANPGTLTGSIGVILNAVNFSELFNKFGIKSNVVKSGKYKDIGSGFRPMTEDDRELLKSLIDNTYNQFVNDVIEARIPENKTSKKDATAKKKKKTNKKKSKKITSVFTVEKFKKYADGRILTGAQAKEIGLVDELGGLYKAKKVALELAKDRFKKINIKTIKFETYDKPHSITEMFLEIKNDLKPQAYLNDQIPFSYLHPNQPLWVME